MTPSRAIRMAWTCAGVSCWPETHTVNQLPSGLLLQEDMTKLLFDARSPEAIVKSPVTNLLSYHAASLKTVDEWAARLIGCAYEQACMSVGRVTLDPHMTRQFFMTMLKRDALASINATAPVVARLIQFLVADGIVNPRALLEAKDGSAVDNHRLSILAATAARSVHVKFVTSRDRPPSYVYQFEAGEEVFRLSSWANRVNDGDVVILNFDRNAVHAVNPLTVGVDRSGSTAPRLTEI